MSRADPVHDGALRDTTFSRREIPPTRQEVDRQLWTGLPELPPASPHALFRLDATRPERELREVLGRRCERHGTIT